MGELIVGLIYLVVGIGLGFAVRAILEKMQSQAADRKASTRLKEAEREAKGLRREAELQAKADVIKARESFEASVNERRKELAATSASLEKREASIAQREENIDRKATLLDRKEQGLDAKSSDLASRQMEVERRESAAAAATKNAENTLQKLSGMTRDEARKMILDAAEKELKSDKATLIRRMQEEAKDRGEDIARDVLLSSMRRYANSHIPDVTTTSVPIGDDVKGKIIGREGRNIKALESVTGVNFIIDESPGFIILSATDPVRREIARRALESLIADGRVNPVLIEQNVKKIQDGFDDVLLEIGRDTAFKANVTISSHEILKKLGALKFRTSFSQNMIMHSIEVSVIMGIIADELGMDANIARRIGLFHDIGKAMDHEVQGTHAKIGADFLRKNGESDLIVAAVEGHHDTDGGPNAYSVLCATADAISASRPGARMEASDIHIQRMEDLEKIAMGYKGVAKSYAVQAGRELRVIADADALDDDSAMLLARDISKKIESTLQYPGRIRVVVIREKRCIEYAN